MLTLPLYNQKGERLGEAELPAEIFGLKINADLIHQAVRVQQANSRRVLAHAKNRSEVRGGGRKPWRQKGTGRSRHGSIRSPIWRHGGVTFGPTKERNFSKKINKKMKRLALMMALSSKLKDQELILLDKLELSQAKTREMFQIMENLNPASKDKNLIKRGALLVAPEVGQKIGRAISNIPKIKAIRADSLNLVDVLSFRYLVLIQGAIEIIKKTYL